MSKTYKTIMEQNREHRKYSETVFLIQDGKTGGSLAEYVFRTMKDGSSFRLFVFKQSALFPKRLSRFPCHVREYGTQAELNAAVQLFKANNPTQPEKLTD